MVQYLFRGTYPTKFDNILYLGCTDGTLIDTVDRLCEENASWSVPNGYVFGQDEGQLSEICDSYRNKNNIEIIEDDFFRGGVNLELDFDYIICSPTHIPWDDLDKETRRDYAINSALITDEDASPVDSDFLYIEQILRRLSESGRAVVLTSNELKTNESAAPLRKLLYYRTEAIEEINLEAHLHESPRLLTVISNELTTSDGNRLHRYNPSEQERNLMGRLDESNPKLDITSMMTLNPYGYEVDQRIADVFLDMICHDFDAALVFENAATRTGLQGYISREGTRIDDGVTIGDIVEPLFSHNLLQPTASIREVIDELSQERFRFVGSNEDIEGIVTRFDLNSLPVYLHLFDLFSEFEIGLRSLIREHLPNWEDDQNVSIRYRGDRSLYPDKLACGRLDQLVQLVESNDLQTEIKRDIRGYEIELSDLVHLRNSVAHYNPIIHTMSDGSTLTDPVRGANQLFSEYQFLRDCIDSLSNRN